VAERVQKIIATSGLASRREAERWIAEGRVTVNRKPVKTPGMTADPSADEIRVNGRKIPVYPRKVYLLLNKPQGYVTTLKDPQGRQTVGDLIKGVKGRVYPVGRLDYDSEGLLLLTNDGAMAEKLTHPRFRVPKTYLVKVKGIPRAHELSRLSRGVLLDGRLAKAERVSLAKGLRKNAWVKITLVEGKKRQVRRMFEALGHAVTALRRLEMGPLKLGELKKGTYRRLTDTEITRLKAL
jgi:pseudouridine synthase